MAPNIVKLRQSLPARQRPLASVRAMRDADVVIDPDNRVIKDRDGLGNRPATAEELRRARRV